MSRAFLTTMPAFTTYAGLKLEVSIAFGADLTSLSGSGWTWTDVTDDVIIGGKVDESAGEGGTGGDAVSITIGRADESSVTQTSVMKCTLDNRSGKYINTGLSTYWPYVRRGTPVRVRVTTDNGSTWSTRFQGQAVGFTPSWDTPGRWATVELEASGPLRVLDQGTLPAKSVYAAEIPTHAGWAGLVSYWPCEGGTGATQLPIGYPVTADGRPRLTPYNPYIPKVILDASTDAFPCSGPLPGSMAASAGGAGFDPLLTTLNTGSVHIRVMAGVSSIPTGQTQPLCYLDTTNTSPVAYWGMMIDSDGSLALQGFNASDVVVRDSGFVAFALNGTAQVVAATLTNSGSGLNYILMTMDQSGNGLTFSGSFTTVNIGTRVTEITAIGPETSSTNGIASQNVIIGHVSYHNQAFSTLNAASPLIRGLPGEAVTTRIPRIANSHGINVDLLSPGVGAVPAYTESANSITLTCGPQYWDTLSNVLRETEATGQGLLYDGLGTGLTYVSRRYRQQRAVAATLTLDASSGHLMEPFDPIDDDQVLFNHVTVDRHAGSRGVEYLDATGAEGANIVGDHATSLTVNPNTDDGLIGYAQWGVNLGTISGFRFPTVSFALHTNASLIPQWLACTPQSRIDITNIAAVRRQLSPDPIWLLLEGWTETIDAFEWKVQANTSSAEPWNVIRLAAATGSTGDDICHMDTDSSQLNTSAALGATSISVRTNSGPLWVQSSADADSFPFWITVGGLRVQVTAITGAASPQTFTLASPGLAAAKTGSTTPGAGAPINIWRPPVLGL